MPPNSQDLCVQLRQAQRAQAQGVKPQLPEAVSGSGHSPCWPALLSWLSAPSLHFPLPAKASPSCVFLVTTCQPSVGASCPHVIAAMEGQAGLSTRQKAQVPVVLVP